MGNISVLTDHDALLWIHTARFQITDAKEVRVE